MNRGYEGASVPVGNPLEPAVATAELRGRGYFDTVREMSTDPVLLAAVDRAEAGFQKCRCGHNRAWHNEPMANGEPCCSECGCDDFEPILNSQAVPVPYRDMRLTKAQRDALDRAQAHPRKHVSADPRTVRALLDMGLIHVGYYGECADGADFGPILGGVDDAE